MNPNALGALSPLDGRYAARLQPLAELFSEAGLIHHRVRVELAWFRQLAQCKEFSALPPLSAEDTVFIDRLEHEFGAAEAAEIKQIERTTNHDVKAVEYWIKQRFATRPSLAAHAELVHFACTSEDINNLAWGMILSRARSMVLDPVLAEIDRSLGAMAAEHAALPMLSRTHGQTASPTTLGKEIANVAFRLRRQRRQLVAIEISGKINGAVGNFNAHYAACPALDWPAIARDFVEDLGLVWNPYTTQIEPHDMIAELAHALVRINTVLLDFARDAWSYISIGYFAQKTVAGEVGSSTMPHKVNPIDFENGEGNLGLANALLEHLAAKLPVSRWQRDLTDSTVQRSIGSALGYCLLAWTSIQRGLGRIEPNPERIASDLDAAWEVLAEPVQTVMRVHGIAEPYEKLKALTRGQAIDRDRLTAFIATLELPVAAREALLALRPADYIGNAAAMAAALDRHS
ncbi:MAG: adenylosuccinate lyase [Gammaproteobacteria bacterium HGW-Gammaproteobacteria-8]|nr:MAG: adenylosuccinate lyase [Gammaproteobacteria bacterium HGW-Gammaproteobacteria-8]